MHRSRKTNPNLPEYLRQMTATEKAKVYGIKSCDTMKKAFTWLTGHGIEYDFHDFKKQDLDDATIHHWIANLPLDLLINKRGTTWRKLDDDTKQGLSPETAVSLIKANPSLVKRPLLAVNNQLHLGFKPEQYDTIFNP